METTKMKTLLVPPDGGWGWIVCLSYGVSNIMFIPIMQTFGIIFRQTFAEIGLNMKDSAVIITTNSAFGMLMGLVNGSILKRFGYRKGAVAGGLLVSTGVILTAFCNDFYSYFFCYGIITSLGFGLGMAAFSLALNSYFREKRGRATGFGMTLTGLGPILMPLLLSYLLDEYGPSGCILIIGAISLNSLVAASVLQPLKWHLKEIIPDQELMPLEKGNELTENLIQKEKPAKSTEDDIHKMIDSTLSIDHDIETQSIYGFETPLPRRKISQPSSVYETGNHRKRTFSRSISQPQPEKHIAAISVNSLNSLRSIAEDEKVKSVENSKNKNVITITTEDEQNILAAKQKKQSFLNKVFKFFDLDLLKDPVYLNLMIGMSLAVCAEINFSLFYPFILDDFGLSTAQIARIMSSLATADIIFRFGAPFFADWLNISCKPMYMISMVMLIIGRSALLFVQHGSFYSILGVSIALGVGKGFRTVFMSLLIPSYVPIEKLPSASGLQMVLNGIVNLASGPILGAIRDSTGSYKMSIIILNSITFAALLMWTLEYIYIRFKRSR